MAEIFWALFFAVLLTALLGYGLRKERNKKVLGAYLVVIFMGTLTFSLWLPALGPVAFGAAWAELLLVALVLAFVAAALTWPFPAPHEGPRPLATHRTGAPLKTLFWAISIMFFVAILAAYLA